MAKKHTKKPRTTDVNAAPANDNTELVSASVETPAAPTETPAVAITDDKADS
jgi:hypothetical protein